MPFMHITTVFLFISQIAIKNADTLSLYDNLSAFLIGILLCVVFATRSTTDPTTSHASNYVHACLS